MKRRPTLSPEAVADLEEIRQYTAERFGEDQARRYMSGLREAFGQLASYLTPSRDVAKDFVWTFAGAVRPQAFPGVIGFSSKNRV